MAEAPAPAVAAPNLFQTVNPATGEKGPVYQGRTVDEALSIAADVHRAQITWRRTGFKERAPLMKKAAKVIRDNSMRYAKLMTDEMGKPITDGLAELEKCASCCEYFAEISDKFLKPVPLDMSVGYSGPGAPPKAFATFNPLGVILAIMPWNFPFWQVIRFAAPHLMAGNGGVLKHAFNVPGCALALEEIFRLAKFPVDLFRTMLLFEAADRGSAYRRGNVDRQRRRRKVGRRDRRRSNEEGRVRARRLGRYIVLEDADPVAAAKICVRGRMVNSGQSCIAAKRLVVVEGVRQAFERALVEEMRCFEMSDPNDPKTVLGPMESVHLRDQIANQVRQSIENGTQVLLGSEAPKRAGAWFPATILTNVLPGQAAHDEELFGPVAAVISAKDEPDAIRIVNASEFGLGSAVITADTARGERIASEELDAGAAFVNQNVRSDPRLPFGGVKNSGYGREVSEFGIREFCNIKTVLIEEL